MESLRKFTSQYKGKIYFEGVKNKRKIYLEIPYNIITSDLITTVLYLQVTARMVGVYILNIGML